MITTTDIKELKAENEQLTNELGRVYDELNANNATLITALQRIEELRARVAELETTLTGLAEWCLRQVGRINSGLVIDPDDDYWRGQKTALQLTAVEIASVLGDGVKETS